MIENGYVFKTNGGSYAKVIKFACHRHLQAWWSGERLDKESGLPHLAHAVCCLLFLMWGDDE